MRYETPAPPAELGEVDGLAYSLWLPEGDPWAGVVILHGARLLQGEPPRLRPRGARGRARRRSASTSAATAPPAARSTAARSTTSPPSRRCSATSRWPCAARAWAATWRSSPPSTLGARAVVAICPASADGLWRGLRSGELDFPADMPVARGVPRRAPARRRGRAARRCRCCSCTPRATSASRSRTRASWRGARPTRAASSSSSRAATTARCSTTPSCRATRCAGCAASWTSRPSPPPLAPEGVGRAGVGRRSAASWREWRGPGGRCSALGPGVARPSAARPSGTDAAASSHGVALPRAVERRRTSNEEHERRTAASPPSVPAQPVPASSARPITHVRGAGNAPVCGKPSARDVRQWTNVRPIRGDRLGSPACEAGSSTASTPTPRESRAGSSSAACSTSPARRCSRRCSTSSARATSCAGCCCSSRAARRRCRSTSCSRRRIRRPTPAS